MPDLRNAFLLPFAAMVWSESAIAQDAGDEPLSAIDWLSQSVTPTALSDLPLTVPDEPPVSDNASSPDITVSPLDSPTPDSIGLLKSTMTGLPPSLWSGSDVETLILLVRAEHDETLPAIQDLVVTLMLAEAAPPLGSGPQGEMFLARVDELLDLGALEPAQAMIELADLEKPEIFRRWFDVSLLTGTEDAACTMIRDRPALASTYPARIFCMARNGDWQAAALTLSTARALGDVSAEEDALISRFLDPDLFEGEPPLPPPTRPSPLVFRMREAIGEALPTASLPRAFAHADLRPVVAWRSQIEAAERLARSGAVSENVLLGTYAANTPSASGGVWDRASAIQALDDAVRLQDAEAAGAALLPAWQAMQSIRTEVPFSRLFAEELTALPLDPEASALAFRIALLSPGYEAAALSRTPADQEEAFWQSVARGNMTGVTSADPRAQAIIAGFGGAPVPEPMASQIRNGQLGEALLRAIAAFNQGLDGDSAALTDSIAIFRAVGLEDVARRASLQYLILDRPA
jgi:hypothetical protein